MAGLGQRGTALESATEALGAKSVRSLRVTAQGATYSVGQNFTPTDPWPRVALTSYVALIDYEHASLRQELVREMGPTMPRGGGVPFTGEVRQIQESDAQTAWDIPVPANPAAGSSPIMPCTPPEAGGTAPRPAPAPSSGL